jgi:signal transduction histidine kinase
LTLTFVVLVATFVYSGYKARTIAIVDEMAHRRHGVQSIFAELLSQRVGLMASAIEFMTQDDRLRQAWQRRDRDSLLAHASPLFNQLSLRYGVTHFYFHDLDGRTFLRVHRPDKFADPVNRITMKQARETGTLSHGLELGTLGTFTHRVVVPWLQQGEVIGYIELGEEIDLLIRKLKDITNTDFLVSIDKAYLDKVHWELGMKMLGRNADWDLLPTRAVIDQTIRNIPKEVIKKISRSVQEEGLPEAVAIDARRYKAVALPMIDAGRKQVGNFVMLNDVTDASSIFKSFVAQILAICLLICSGLFAFAYAILGRTDRTLFGAQRQLLDQIDRAANINSLLEVEIGERRRAEKNLTALNESLEERVVERTRKLEHLNRHIKANQQALEVAYADLKTKQATILHQDKMAGIGQLAAGVAHDINNPIGFVFNNLQSMETYSSRLVGYLEKQAAALRACASDELLRELEETYKELKLDFIMADFRTLIEESIEGTARVSKIVKNLHTFSRIDDSECRESDILECLESTINITRNELRYKAVVKRDYAEVPKLCCFPEQLNQVFMNLLINAAQAIEQRGEITVKVWSSDDAVFVAISDTGSGISPENQDRIFEPFYTTKEVGKGTGLGLSITYDIIKKHQGDITVESELGKGTTFTIRLPLAGGLVWKNR